MEKFYTGIGVAQVSGKMKDSISSIAKYFSDKGYTLRTDLDKGMNEAFRSSSESKELYAIEGETVENAITAIPTDYILSDMKENCLSLTAINKESKKKIVRGYYELLGKDLKTPSEFLVCYDPCTGVVNHIHRLANRLGIKVYNLYEKDVLKELLQQI